ncbi:hypothetical protein [Streptomyces sp. NPDC053048]|uniref:hypothetical protein n=1 Tax=Streptomyces sp. NPDC053048 TaxID=3365694 RepID=UPI0037D7FBF3
MTRIRRIATVTAATLLLTVSGAVLASPAQADVDLDLLRGALDLHANSLVAVGALGAQIVSLPISLEPLL